MMDKMPEQIRRLRKEKGWSQEHLATLLNVSRAKISNWERGETDPDLHSIARMSEIFHVSIDFLFGKHPTDEQLLQEVKLAYGTNEMDEERLALIRYMNEQRELAKRLYALQSLPSHKRKRVEEVVIKIIDEMIEALK